jgi:hypothetical protein
LKGGGGGLYDHLKKHMSFEIFEKTNYNLDLELLVLIVYFIPRSRLIEDRNHLRSIYLIQIVDTISYWLNIIPTSEHHGEIYNLQTYINKYHYKQELQIAKSKFTYIDK